VREWGLKAVELEREREKNEEDKGEKILPNRKPTSRLLGLSKYDGPRLHLPVFEA
jgi:hypothetical protein